MSCYQFLPLQIVIAVDLIPTQDLSQQCTGVVEKKRILVKNRRNSIIKMAMFALLLECLSILYKC